MLSRLEYPDYRRRSRNYGRVLFNAVMFVRKARKEGAMNRGAVGSRHRETGTDAHCPAMTARKVARKAVVVLSICFFSGTLSTAIGQQPTPSVTAIESLIRSRQYDQALAMTRSALEQRPTDFRLWTLEGIIFSMQDKAQRAQSAFEKALRISPQYAPALKGEVQILYDQGDNRAIPLLERILKDDPKDQTLSEYPRSGRPCSGEGPQIYPPHHQRWPIRQSNQFDFAGSPRLYVVCHRGRTQSL